jgi:hypothetical protein
MFDSKQTLTNRLADAADLLIDFATLGEYGLEPVGRTAQHCEAGHRPPAARQPRDRQCAPQAPGKSATPTTFSTVTNDSPYFDILCGPRRRLQGSPPPAPRRPGSQGQTPRVRALREARI